MQGVSRTLEVTLTCCLRLSVQVFGTRKAFLFRSCLWLTSCREGPAE